VFSHLGSIGHAIICIMYYAYDKFIYETIFLYSFAKSRSLWLICSYQTGRGELGHYGTSDYEYALESHNHKGHGVS